jgi:hypothetical protein
MRKMNHARQNLQNLASLMGKSLPNLEPQPYPRTVGEGDEWARYTLVDMGGSFRAHVVTVQGDSASCEEWYLAAP